MSNVFTHLFSYFVHFFCLFTAGEHSKFVNICTPWKIRTFICGFGDRYATITPKRCVLVMRDSNLPPSRYQRDALTKWANYQYEQVFGFEPKSPVWKTRALTVVLYLQLVDEQHLLLLWLPTKAHYFISSKQKNPLTFGLEGLYNSNVIYIYPTSVSSNNAQLPPQIRFGWLQILCVKDALIVNIYLIFKIQ